MTKKNLNAIAIRISNELNKIERSQSWLARKSGLSTVTIYRVVNGISTPSLPTLSKISAVLNFNLTEMAELLMKESNGENNGMDNLTDCR